MLRDTLALYAYTPPSNRYPLIVGEYGAEIEELEFTTVAPGGFGDLACGLRLTDIRASPARARAIRARLSARRPVHRLPGRVGGPGAGPR